VGAAIKENRQVDREKYSELKLQANFLRSSPSYATTHPLEGSFGFYTDTADVVVTPLLGQPTNFYIVRHADYRSLHSVEYKLLANTSAGSFQIPQLGNSLSLHGRDSKIHVTDYQAGDFTLVYSTSEIFSWAKTNTKTVLIMYGGLAETHEFSVSRSLGCPKRIEGGEVDCKIIKSLIVIQFNIQKSRKVIYFSPGLEIYLVWRNEAYNYWTLDLPKEHSDNVPFAPLRTNDTNATVIVKAGYLLRNASMEGTTLELFGDINRTTEIEIIAAPVMPTKLFFNGKKVCITRENQSPTRGTVVYHEPEIPLPDLSRLEWRFVNSLPEIQRDYDDKDWTPCTLQVTNNTRNLTTPTSLYAGDYGYHSGSVLYRGHFLAAESASHVSLHLQGGSGFGHSVWLNSSYLGSWAGHGSIGSSDQTLAFPQKLEKGKPYVLTILMDQMGLRDNWEVDLDGMRQPRGILDYSIPGLSDKSRIFWKVMGNFGGERYVDHSRGPLNEGSLFAERQGYHLPGAPTQDWPKRSPLEGLGEPDVGFFSTSFTLDMPKGYDVPISLVLGGIDHAFFRVQIFINGWQFGKYSMLMGRSGCN
jgi:beta-galactosidase